ncbi:PREDICTED: venom allergen 5-like [Papilio polytes]|uniref:venom allergen 5-like n=1 Tax=Papilio polytes TaxID=76194 RepID=UPI0006765B6A|nr:PREDICTED: venom allergen 5-like [Papilio polytes]
MHSKIIFIFALCGFVHSKLINLSCNQIRDIVDGHNARRQQLAQGVVPGHPAASDMKYMVWDEELAAKARKWASRNEFNHNPDKTIGSGRFKTGENLYSFGSTSPGAKINIDKSLSAWFDEYKDYTYGPLTRNLFDGSSDVQIGHYTQMAWADTTYVGCGLSQYWERGMKTFLLVCNYGPGGNILGQTPYTESDEGGNSLQCSIGDCSAPYGDKC